MERPIRKLDMSITWISDMMLFIEKQEAYIDYLETKKNSKQL